MNDREAQHQRIRRFLGELDEIHGPIAPEILEEVRRKWPGEPESSEALQADGSEDLAG